MVPPLCVFGPDRVNVPAPSFVNTPEPEMTPENVVLLPLLPTVRFANPSWTCPAPASEPNV